MQRLCRFLELLFVNFIGVSQWLKAWSWRLLLREFLSSSFEVKLAFEDLISPILLSWDVLLIRIMICNWHWYWLLIRQSSRLMRDPSARGLLPTSIVYLLLPFQLILNNHFPIFFTVDKSWLLTLKQVIYFTRYICSIWSGIRRAYDLWLWHSRILWNIRTMCHVDNGYWLVVFG